MVALACFAYILTFLICNIFRKKNYFRLSTFNRDAFFRVELYTLSITLSFQMTYTQTEISKLLSPRREMQPVALVKPDLQRDPYALIFSPRPMHPWPNPPFGPWWKECNREGGGRLSTTEKRTKLEQTEILSSLFTECCKAVIFKIFRSRTPRYIVASILYTQSFWFIIRVIHNL